MSQGLLIPAEVAAKLNERAETCGNCRWMFKPNQTPDLECRIQPPTASLNLVPIDARLARPGMAPMELRPYSLFPLVQPDMWCGKWEPKVTQ